MRLIQLLPRLQPFDGVSDYALLLARILRDARGVVTTFIAAGTSARDSPPDRRGDFDVHTVAPSLPALDTALAAATAAGDVGGLLLHYVGYGYARRGAPLWLPTAIAGARVRLRCPVGVVFHELYASGPPWTSAFWLGGLQRLATRRIGALSDWALTARAASARWLEQRGGLHGRRIVALPMCSNVGEPGDAMPVAERPPMLVVWGGAAAKRQVYGPGRSIVAAVCRSLGISRIVDIGAAPQCDRVGDVPVEIRGQLPAEAVSQVLLGCRFGLLRYPASFVSKSSIFAAFAAHRLVPVLLDSGSAPSLDGLEPGRHFLPAPAAATMTPDDATLEGIAASAHQWYAGHTGMHHADAIWRMFREAVA